MTSILRLRQQTNTLCKTFTELLNRCSISTNSTLFLKEINETKQGENIIISGTYIDSPRTSYLLQNPSHDSCCTLCNINLNLTHTDVLILSQFVRSDGCMLPRRVTQLCRKQQKKVSTLVTMAQKAGLLSNLNPASSKKDPKKRYQWKKFNKYFFDV